jgi:RHS repeat-associated protein
VIQPAERAHESLQRFQKWMDSERSRRVIHSHTDVIHAIDERGGGRTEYTYDARGELAQITEPGGAVTRFAYDTRRRLTKVTHADGTITAYAYGSDDRLIRVETRGVVTTYEHDDTGRVIAMRTGNSGARRFAYDAQGRPVSARTALVAARWVYNERGQIAALEQAMGGTTLRACMAYDTDGRLARLELPGASAAVHYEWNAQGRPAAVWYGTRLIARWTYDDTAKTMVTQFASGATEISAADPLDSRPLWRRCVLPGVSEPLLERVYQYDDAGHRIHDGARAYDYDELGRLSGDGERCWRYDAQDNVTEDSHGERTYNALNCLLRIDHADGSVTQFRYDAAGRPVHKSTPQGEWRYQYDENGHLIQAAFNGDPAAQFTYDHKGRLTRAAYPDRAERYFYGAADELLAITDDDGAPQTLFVRTPFGLLALIDGYDRIFYTHNDDRGNCHALSDEAGTVAARFAYTPYGEPEATSSAFRPIFGGRLWHAAVGMYDFGVRWYDPALCRFLTPDPCTAAPDDMRLTQPFTPSSRQGLARDRLLAVWLKQPRLRNRYVYCGNDPLNRHDPDGHWSFGGVLLMIVCALWALPLTLLGLAVEILNLTGEVVRWLAYIFSGGNLSWETPGFDVAASGRLQTFALVFTGGWIGSFPGMLAIAFGNVFFVYKHWERNERFFGPGDYYPPAYKGNVAIPRRDALYEHELRHANHAGWFGLFYHFGLPIWGVYEWDLILSGSYWNSWAERNARAYSEDDVRPIAAPVMNPSAPAGPPGLPALYGNYNLHRGDRDAGYVYEGTARTAAAGHALPAAGEPGFVRQLQDDLRRLGFRLIDTAENGTFGRTTEWAVREFQVYARMTHGAQEAVAPAPAAYLERLSQVEIEEEARYSGPVSGVVNASTRAALARWLENRWRCPVVIAAYDISATPHVIYNNHENIWKHNEVTRTTNVRMFARDFSGYYTRDGASFPAARDPNGLIPLGKYTTYLTWSGQQTLPEDEMTWSEAELLPEHLVGVNLAGLSAAQRSTYKVIRAVSEVETLGYFDGLNGYDNAFVSVGPCHWILGRAAANGSVEEGELGGYLAYLRYSDADAFTKAIEFFGMRCHLGWADGGTPNGSLLFRSGPRKYAGWVATQQEDGSFSQLARSEVEGNYFKNWHWYYRFLMAGRTVEGYRRHMWHMARVRLRDMLSAPWPASAHVPSIPLDSGGTRPATIGDVYVSERAVALLLRWHIRFPAHILSGGRAGGHLVAAYRRAAIPAAAGDPTQWTNVQEASLLAGIMNEAQSVSNDINRFETTMNYVRDWPQWATGDNPRHFQLDASIGRLGITRENAADGTVTRFQFDDSDLPPAPY